MSNSKAKAAAWVRHFVDHSGAPFARQVGEHFEAGRISRLCECGCNSFDIEIPAATVLEPISPPGGSGMFCEVQFESDAGAELTFLVFVDVRGYLTGLDVTLGSNHAPVPDLVRIGRVVYRSPDPL